MADFFQATLVPHLRFGQTIFIKAQAEPDATWFHISLTTGRVEHTSHIDVGLHILVSINEAVIVFKQCLRDKWRDLKQIAFNTEQFLAIFTLSIIMGEHNYHIVVNDEPCVYIEYGVPLKLLNTLKINGHMQRVQQVDHRQHFPCLWPPVQFTEDYIDFSNEQPTPFTAGQVMVIKIKLSGNQKGRLILQFRNAWELGREELHMSVRFGAKKLICNSKLPLDNSEDLQYGKEECHNAFPFDSFFQPFKLAIALTSSSFRIAKNGVFICDYAYRTANVVRELMGVKLFGTDGAKVRVFNVDYIFLNKEDCANFATYSAMKHL